MVSDEQGTPVGLGLALGLGLLGLGLGLKWFDLGLQSFGLRLQGFAFRGSQRVLQGYLAHKKTPPARALQ